MTASYHLIPVKAAIAECVQLWRMVLKVLHGLWLSAAQNATMMQLCIAAAAAAFPCRGVVHYASTLFVATATR